MGDTNTNSEKIFLVLGIVVVISGILLLVDKNYLIGTSGSIVGIGLILDNMKKIKLKNNGE